VCRRLQKLAACQHHSNKDCQCTPISHGAGLAVPNASTARGDRGWSKIQNLDPEARKLTWGKLNSLNHTAMVAKLNQGKLVRNVSLDTDQVLQMRKDWEGTNKLLSMFFASQSVGALATPLGQERQCPREVQEWQSPREGQELQSPQQVQDLQSISCLQEPQGLLQQLQSSFSPQPQVQQAVQEGMAQTQPPAKPLTAQATTRMPFGVNSVNSSSFHRGGVAAPFQMPATHSGQGYVASEDRSDITEPSPTAPGPSLTVVDSYC
jgi:hypothetical protein